MTDAVAIEEEPVSTKKLAISPDLKLPCDTVTATVIVYGGKGMGKTNFGSVLAEELAAAGLKFAWLDPPGVSWGLRHSANGKGPGIEVLILGGPHGDIPIEPTAGEVVADLVVDNDVNVVIDISRKPDGTMWSIADRVRFVTAYAKRIYQRQGEKRRPIMQVLDEAARFIPQIVRSGEAEVAACMGALAVLVEEGRNVGVGVTFITQRSARLNKDVAELADCMIAFRTVGPNSRRAVMDWLGEHVEKDRLKDLDDAVRKLPVGSALVVSPGWLEFEGVVKMRARETFDSSATPKPGETRKASGPGAKPDLAKYRELMAETIERAKATDPKLLRQRVAELERQLATAAKASPAPAPAKEKRVEVPVLKDAQVKRLEELGARAEKAVEAFAAAAREVRPAMLRAIEATRDARPISVHAARASPERSFSAPNPRPAPRPHRESNGADHDASVGNSGLRRMLIALAQRPQGLTNKQLGVRAGVSSRSGTFATYLGKARSNGWIDGRGHLQITEAGLAALGSYDPLPEGRALADYWLGQLGSSGAARMLRVLLEAYPAALDRTTLGERAEISPASGTYATYLGKLRSLELVEGHGELRASGELIG